MTLHAGGQRRFGADAPKIVFGVKDAAALRDELLLRGTWMGETSSPRPGIMVCDGIDPEGNRFSVEMREPVKA